MIDAEDVITGVGKIIKHILIHFLVNFVLFYLGFIVLKTFTFWHYPPAEMTDKDENVVVITGACTPFVLFGCFFVYNNFMT